MEINWKSGFLSDEPKDSLISDVVKDRLPLAYKLFIKSLIFINVFKAFVNPRKMGVYISLTISC